jgi:hypothetical protein
MTDDPFVSLLASLRVIRRRDDRAEALCPAHDDKRASLSVARGDEQPIVLHCHAGCSVDTILSALGLSMAAVTNGQPRLAKTYTYTDERGAPLYTVERWASPKTFRPCALDGHYRRPAPADEVLYNLPAVAKMRAEGGTVYIVEGEQDVDTLTDFGLVGTSAMSGADQPWLPQFSEALAGCDVVIVGDNDKPGRARARRLYKELAPYTKRRRAVVARFGKDISDHLWAGYDLDLLQPLPSESALVCYSMAHVKAQPMTWAWDGWIPEDMFTLIEGDPGDGKSVLGVELAARWSTGMAMPDSAAGFGEPVRVGLMSAEDDVARVIKPRLIVAGGDPNGIVYLAGMPMGDGYLRTPDLGLDLAAIRETIETEQLRVFILDPLMAYMGSVKTAIDSEVRKTLAPLRTIAEECHCAIVAIRHLRKTGGKAVYSGGGSIAFTGAARAVLLVGRNPGDDEQRVLAMTKSNVSAAPPASLGYHVVADVCDGIVAPRVQWDGSVAVTATELLAADTFGSTVSGEIASELVEILADEPAGYDTIRQRLAAAGVDCNPKTLRSVLRTVAVKIRTGAGKDNTVCYRLRSASVPAGPLLAAQDGVHNPQVKSDLPLLEPNTFHLRVVSDLASNASDPTLGCSVCRTATDVVFWDDVAEWRCQSHNPLTYRDSP